ncbi:MAG TPA: prolyl oligopeptidase family serine peptidase [Thermoanaerobaculia bacterium]|nr:prolyl oligopeptidase family serine peptidase [Thermoanaerobaculia bacterium]
MKAHTPRLTRSSFLAVLLLSLSLVYPAAAPAQEAKGGFTLEQVLSAPFPSDLTAAGTGGQVAWVQNARGVRNLWIAAPPDYRGRQVTSYTRDDGQALSGLAWSADGKTLFYVRGSGANRQGEVPNPAGDPGGAEQAVWRISAEGGEPVRIGVGSQPTPSPKGDGVAFVRRGQIFWAPLASDGAEGGKSAEPVQWLQARGTASALRFSPDGSKLAFTSGRGDHNFIGVYDVAAKAVRWMAPGVDQDGSPAWSPDGTRLAFVRVPAQRRTRLFLSNRSGHPWSILVADPATGQARTVWRARPGDGSVFRVVVADDQLLWGAGDRLVFPSEADGWLHLYSVPVAGGEATLLTPGEFEVEYVTLSPDRRTVLYNSNQGDIDRRHLWRVDVAGGTPAALTRGDGIEWSPTAVGNSLAYLRSGARRQAHAVIQVGNGEPRELAPGTVPAEFPEAALVEPEPVVFTSGDGMRIHAQLFKPRDIRQGERRPALLFLHGGSHRQMLLGWHYSGYYNNTYAMNQYLAGRGYLVLAVNFRAGTGYGMHFREALRQGAGGASEFADVLGAALYLRGRPDVDPRRIGLWGGSYGGYLTAMGLARAPELFAAGVDIHGAHDWNDEILNFVPSYEPTPEEERLAFQSSPMAWLDLWRAPVLLIHGDDDRNVPFSESVRLAEALRERGVEVEAVAIPDEIHGFLRYQSWLDVFRAAGDFFDRKLKAKTD